MTPWGWLGEEVHIPSEYRHMGGSENVRTPSLGEGSKFVQKNIINDIFYKRINK